MPYRNVIEKDQPFHVISRAVEERKIFADLADCYRFIFQLHAANIGSPRPNTSRIDVAKVAQSLLHGERVANDFIAQEHSPLVHILDFCLNVTHYHLHILPNAPNNMPLFIKKLNGNFAKYFNLKHGRTGALFSSRYKSVPIETDFQSDAVSRYVSITNPLDMHQPGWRENGLLDQGKALEFLQNYQFSSFPDKIGIRKAGILAPAEILERYGVKDYPNFVKDFLQQKLVMPNI